MSRKSRLFERTVLRRFRLSPRYEHKRSEGLRRCPALDRKLRARPAMRGVP